MEGSYTWRSRRPLGGEEARLKLFNCLLLVWKEGLFGRTEKKISTYLSGIRRLEEVGLHGGGRHWGGGGKD